MNQQKIKDGLDKLLAANKDLPLSEKGNRDLLVQQILHLVEGKPTGNTGATVMTESASMYDPKRHGKDGSRPQSIG
jgi:hypothetical protein